MTMELDEALKALGDFGRYQSIVYVLICLVGQLTQSWHMLAISFLGAVPDHYCHVQTDVGAGNGSGSSGDPSNFYPVDSGESGVGEVVYSSCLRYVNISVNNETEKCKDGWTYDVEEYGITIATEWDLVCENDYKINLSTSIFMAGVMVGSLLFGQLSDRFGRKPVWFGSIWMQVAFGVAVAFSPSYWWFVTLRFFVGVLEQGVDLTSYVMVTEMFSPSKRGPAGILLTLFWATGIMSLPGLAYLIKDWHYLQLAISLPNVLTLCIITIIPESTRWLLSRGKTEKAENILQNIAKFNDKDIPSPILSVSGSNEWNSELQANGTGTLGKKTKVNPKLRRVPSSSQTDQYDRPNGDAKTLTLVEGDSFNGLGVSGPGALGDVKHHTVVDLFRTRKMRNLTIIMIFLW